MSRPPSLPGDTRQERKNNWDRLNRKPCACGTPMSRGAVCCWPCHCRLEHQRRDARRGLIELRWNEGATLKQIAALLSTTPMTISVELARMRAEGGWRVPTRNPGGGRRRA